MAEVHATDFEPVIVLREGQQEQERPRGRQSRGVDGQPLQLSTSHPYMPNYLITPDSAGFPGFHTADWLTGTSYPGYETQNQWSHDGVPYLETSSPYEDISQSNKTTYTRSEPYHAAAGYYLPPLENTDGFSQMQSVNQLVANYPTYYLHPTHIDQTHSPHNQIPLQAASVTSYDTLSPYETTFNSDLHQNQSPVWPAQFSQEQPLEYDTSVNLSPVTPFSTSQLHWPAGSQITPQSLSLATDPVAPPKRKRASPDPAPPKRSRTNDPQKNLSEFVVVFENAPGALSTVKHRRKLDAPVRKAARDVRKAGACHQCRFRKRTCSTGTPCMSCLKNGNGLHEVKCQRESPFVGKLVHQYFEFSSTKRIVCFEVNIPLDLIDDSNREILTIDGIGRVSHTIKIHAGKRLLSSFDCLEQDAILQTSNSEPAAVPKDDIEVVLLGDDKKLGQQIEQWAVEYTSKFVHAAGPAFYSTTMAQILGTAYVKKELPESKLVATMLRVACLAFVLRAGIKFSSSTSDANSNFRTVQARVDTILYGRLQIAEMELFQMLQRLIFRTAGCLTREQIFPVALVLWQLIRIVSLSSSHLSNIAKKFQSKAHGQADYQFVSLRLLLSTHMALFRSSNPLLLAMDEKNNRDLVGDDDELIGLCLKMRNVVLTFRDKGFPEMKGSIAYKKEHFDMFRKVYTPSRS
ncbi:hypothetical protein HYALB_00007087 [Hymenoscyphus albidus]|uniref:Zn(2)-C6 fungal-type domain-containing protein n=1 Tax=Hymenoscyphus albidus TaxID=595503 RepID=A0A9N9LNT6_9HELO|nr:hypothetical protein HYALB_00007087 [Hymenoscyphus albidus]